MAERRPDTQSEIFISSMVLQAMNAAKRNQPKRTEPIKKAETDKDVCSVCGEPLWTQTYSELYDLVFRHPRMCACKRTAIAARQEAERLKKLNDARNRCFHGEEHQHETWSADDPTKNTNSRARNAFETVKAATTNPEYWERKRAQGVQGFILAGPTGTGKTYIASAAANSFVDQGKGAAVWRISDLMAKQYDDRREGKRAETFWDEILSPELLVIDDLFAENRSQATITFEYDLLDKRLERTKRPESKAMTIITTNMDVETIMNGNQTGENRVFSRTSSLDLLMVPGADIRKTTALDRYSRRQTFSE